MWLLFFAGMAAGSVLSLVIIAFMAVVSEDWEKEEQARRQREKDVRRRRDIEDWYRRCD